MCNWIIGYLQNLNAKEVYVMKCGINSSDELRVTAMKCCSILYIVIGPPSPNPLLISTLKKDPFVLTVSEHFQITPPLLVLLPPGA